MKMHSLGVKRARGDLAVPVAEQGMTYPTLQLNDDTCPFLKDVSQGDTVKFYVEARVTGIREAEAWDDKKGANYFSLELKQAGYEEPDEAGEDEDKE